MAFRSALPVWFRVFLGAKSVIDVISTNTSISIFYDSFPVWVKSYFWERKLPVGIFEDIYR